MTRSVRWWVSAALLVPVAATAQIGGGAFAGCSDVGTDGLRADAVALTSPFALLVVNSTCIDLSDFIQNVTPGKIWQLNADLDLAAATIKVRATFNADPFITFGATTTNVLSPVTYGFLFGTPVVPGFYNSATSTGGVSVTNGASGTTTVSNSVIYPTYISGYGTVGGAATNLGVDLGTAPCVASGTPFTVTTTCNQGTTANTFAPTFYDNLEALLTYKQDDIASVASWSGAVTLNATTVPEPSTLALLVGGLAFVGGVSARRRRVAAVR